MLSPELKRRVLEGIQRTPSPTRGQARRRAALLYPAALLVLGAIFAYAYAPRAAGSQLFGDGSFDRRPQALVLGTLAGAALVAGLALWAALGRGRSALGRPLGWLAIVALATPVVLLGWKVGWTSAFAGMMAEDPVRPGLKCLGWTLAMGACPLLAFAAARRFSDPVHPAATGAAIGMAVAALTWCFVDLWCPICYVPHLLLGHVLPSLLLALGGALLGRWLLAIRPGETSGGRERSGVQEG
jgi:Negative regulator of sigma F